jgi:hypothetical protein
MTRPISWFWVGATGTLCLALFWFAYFNPAKADAMMRPHGLYILFALLFAAIVLPAAAGIRSKKSWLGVSAVGLATAILFFVRVFA